MTNVCTKSVVRRGFTLIELMVVIALLAILTALVIPKLDGLQSNANHGVGAAACDDLGRFIQIYRSSKQRLPDGWDSLMDASGSALWAPANPGTNTPGLHTQLSGPTAKLEVTTLAAGEVAAFNSAGIFTLYDLDGSTKRPGDRFNTQVTLDTTHAVAQVSTTNGKKIIDHIYRDNQKTGGVSGTLPAGKRLIAFGFGPHNALVGKMMLEVPYYPNVDPTLVYNRNLVIFEVGTTGRAVFKAVVGTDGDLIDDLAAAVSKDPA